MVRTRKLGTEVCPKCQNIGRIRMKRVRSRLSARYIRRAYFHHNDPNIEEHYIDNFTRPKHKTPHQEDKEALAKFGHRIVETTRRLCQLPLTRDEEMWLASCLIFVSRHILDPLEEADRLHKQDPVKNKNEINKLKELVLRNLKSEKNIFLNGLKSSGVYEKYIVPAMTNRRKIINKKIKRSYNYPRPTLPTLTSNDLTFNPPLE